MKKLLIILITLGSYQAKAQCNSATIFANETSNAYCTEINDKVRSIFSNNFPDHSDNYNQPMFSVSAGDYSYYTCAYPKISDTFTPLYETTETTKGCTTTYTFGININGIKYDPNSALTFENTNTGEANINWHVEATSTANNIGKNMGTDNGGHINPFGEYHYHNIPINYFTNNLGIDATNHSPIVGYAADGFPIYYKYVYADVADANSSVISLSSSYSLRTGARPGNGISAPDGNYDGNYVEDYEYIEAISELDECNGRFGVTPDFPEGTYYYVLTSEFPYIPRCFKGTSVDNSFRIGPSSSCPDSTASTSCSESALSIEILNLENEVSIYPNPAINKISISIDEKYTSTISKIEIYSITGKLVFTKSEFTKNIDISNFSKGVYFLSLNKDDGAFVIKLVKE